MQFLNQQFTMQGHVIKRASATTTHTHRHTHTHTQRHTHTHTAHALVQHSLWSQVGDIQASWSSCLQDKDYKPNRLYF